MSNKPVNIADIYERFPTQESCIKRLEQVKWNGHPVCPYCFSDQVAREKSQNRWHCNHCNTSFSVTVNTIFHNSKLPLQKWFLAITLILNAKKGISAKQLQLDLKVTYKTAWYLAVRIRRAMIDQGDLLRGIVEMDETYVVGKPRKQNKKDDQTPNKRGRGTKKIPVVGMLERRTENRVVLKVQKTLGANDLLDLVRQKVNTQCSTVITDEYRGYAKLNQVVKPISVAHSKC